MPPTLAALFATSLDGADWLQVLENDASLLHALDAFLARACAAQSKRFDTHSLSDEELQDWDDDACVAFALYTRLLSVLEAPPVKKAVENAMRATLLHAARLVPFCQVFGARAPQRIRALLDAAVANVEGVKTDVTPLAGVFTAHLEQLHVATQQNKRNQVVDLIQSVFETSSSICALSWSPSVVELLFRTANEDTAVSTGSLLRALAVCFETDIPVLQRNLSKLDDAVQKKVALLIPETRRVLLQMLDNIFQTTMDEEKASAGTGERVLTIIHELSHSTDAEAADHGSFISDLWHLCSYEAKLLAFFDDIKLDRDSVSYLEVILDGLPRRRVLVESDHDQPHKSEPSASAEPAETSSTSTHAEGSASDDLTPFIAQVQDLFPDLGDGYVALCLLSSQRQLETVINYLLESNPPPVVSSVRKDLKRSDTEYASLERQALGKEPLTSAAAPTVKSEKVDPSRIWRGKRAQEKHYDPQVARKDPSIVEKVMQIVDEYAEEDNFREAARAQGAKNPPVDADTSATPGGIVLDEYDDDYNDEYEDYEPFSVHDGGEAEDFDAIRLHNRRLRELEAEDAFWEGMRNQNRRAVDLEEEGDDGEEDEDESKEQAPSHWARGPARAEWNPQQGGAPRGNASRGRGPSQRGADGAPAPPMSEKQVQRQRQRDNKNKAKVGNHNRKDRALKKRG